MNKILVAVAVVIVLGFGAFALSRPKSQPSSSTSTSSQTSSSGQSTSGSDQTQAAAVITYTANGFSPAMTTIKSGQSVTFTNNSSDEIQVDSNPHPVHTDDTDLNVGPIAPGQSKTVTLTKKGTFGFHNHLNPSSTAQITIE